MTAKEQRAYENIRKWRSMDNKQRKAFLRTSAVKQTASSMAMEGEPVSAKWLKKNAR